MKPKLKHNIKRAVAVCAVAPIPAAITIGAAYIAYKQCGMKEFFQALVGIGFIFALFCGLDWIIDHWHDKPE